jgi:hypothetical protein
MATLRIAVVLMLLMLGGALISTPTASASCSSDRKTQYIQLLDSRGQQAVGLDDKETRYLQLLKSNGVPMVAGRTSCEYALTAYQVLYPIANSSMTLGQVVAAIMKETGMNHDQASSMMNAVFNSFGFPPTCDMCNDPWHGSPFPPPGHN